MVRLEPSSQPIVASPNYFASERFFEVGDRVVQTVFVKWSVWAGLRTYATDATGASTAKFRGACCFDAGTSELHQIEIRVTKSGSIDAYADDELVLENLFPRVRQVTVLANTIAVASLLFATVYLATRFIFAH